MSDESDGEDGSALTDGSSDASESELPGPRLQSPASAKRTRLVSRKRSIGRRITVGFFALWSVDIGLSLAAFFYSYGVRDHAWHCSLMPHLGATAAAQGAGPVAGAANRTDIPLWQYMSVVGLISRHRRDVVQSAMLVDVALLCFAVSVVTAMVQVVRDPDQLPKDFKLKGTLSNIVQDTTTPVGRMFAVGFFAAGICWVSSMYTFTLYRPWMGFDPRAPPAALEAGLEALNAVPLLSGVINLPNFEYFVRVCWAVGPAVGCMLAATIPSLSESTGYENAETLVHNILAPLSLLFCITMESVQLLYGENTFYYFFRSELTPFQQELTPMQRVRTVSVASLWFASALFFGFQIYIGGINCFNLSLKKTGYTVALLSFYSEVSMCFLIVSLPALAGLDTLMDPCMQRTAAELAVNFLAPNTTLPASYQLGAT